MLLIVFETTVIFSTNVLDAKNHDANEISKKSSRKRKNTNMTLQKSPTVGMAFSNLVIYK